MIHRYVRKFGVDPVDQLELLMLQHAVDRQPLRLSKAELDLLHRMPRPADPAPLFDGDGGVVQIDFGAEAINPNGDLEP